MKSRRLRGSTTGVTGLCIYIYLVRRVRHCTRRTYNVNTDKYRRPAVYCTCETDRKRSYVLRHCAERSGDLSNNNNNYYWIAQAAKKK